MSGQDEIILVTGVANHASIAWAVTRELCVAGRRCVLAVYPANRRRVEKLVAREKLALELCDLDVRDEQSIADLARWISSKGDHVVGIVHAIAYAGRDDLGGRTLDCSRSGFLESLEVSVYSLIAIIKSLESRLRPGTSIVALSYHGSRYCIPGYNLMGVAKAALESAVRYLAGELGPQGVRVNTVSAGPLLTLSSSAFDDIEQTLERGVAGSALKVPLSAADVSSAVCYLLAPGAGGITGQCLSVDNGLLIMRDV